MSARTATPGAELLTPAEFAATFRVKPPAVRRWIASGRVDAVNVIRTPTNRIHITAEVAAEIPRSSTRHRELK
jgi:hypothetical protein